MDRARTRSVQLMMKNSHPLPLGLGPSCFDLNLRRMIKIAHLSESWSLEGGSGVKKSWWPEGEMMEGAKSVCFGNYSILPLVVLIFCLTLRLQVSTTIIASTAYKLDSISFDSIWRAFFTCIKPPQVTRTL